MRLLTTNMKSIAATALGTWFACTLALAQQPAPAVVASPPGMADRVAACMACHGKEGRATADGYYPRIAGKPAGYLLNQLQGFRDGHRRYPMMNYLLTNLSDDYLQQIANFFAAQHPPYPPPLAPAANAALLERGRILVSEGDRQRRIPACSACHGARLGGVQPAIPGLLGLPRDYINAQLGAWRNGERSARAPDCMAAIARELTPEDVNAASSWLSGQTVPADYAPASSLSTPLPRQCGSQPQAAGARP